MLGRRFLSTFFKKNSTKSKLPSSTPKAVDEENGKSLGRKAVSFVLITVTGGVALSALDDLSIYHGCSSKAFGKIVNNQQIKDALGEPIVKGPWYNASLAVAHKRQSVSCTFPLSGPQGTGVLQFKAVRNGEDTWFSFLRPHDWDIIIMDALLHVPGNDEKHRTFRISVSDFFPPPPAPLACAACTDCKPQEPENPYKK